MAGHWGEPAALQCPADVEVPWDVRRKLTQGNDKARDGRHSLVSSDGDNLGSIETSDLDLQPGDELLVNGNLPYRIVSVIPLERIVEFVDEPVNGMLEVEPV